MPQREAVKTALVAAVAALARTGIHGSFVLTRGRVEWVSDAGSDLRITGQALHEAARQLRAAGIAADVVPGMAFVLTAPLIEAPLVEADGLPVPSSRRGHEFFGEEFDEEPAEAA